MTRSIINSYFILFIKIWDKLIFWEKNINYFDISKNSLAGEERTMADK